MLIGAPDILVDVDDFLSNVVVGGVLDVDDVVAGDFGVGDDSRGGGDGALFGHTGH